MTVELLYHSNKVAASDRVSIWSEVVWKSYVPLAIKVPERSNFIGKVASSHLGNVRIVTSGSRAQQISRTPNLIALDAEEYLMLGLQLRGTSVVEQQERQALLHRGDFVFWDTRRPYNIIFPSNWEMAVFQFPRNAFGFDNHLIDSIVALTSCGNTAMSRVAAALLMSIAQDARTSSFEDKNALLDHAMGVLTLSVDHRPHEGEPAVTYNQLLFRRIETYILDNLKTPCLRVADIARENGLTTSQLYRIFQQRDLTIIDYVRRKRLHKIKEDLANPRSRNLTIAAIAIRWGFTDIPHFNRVFKNYYGVSPKQFRAIQSKHAGNEP